MTSSILFLAGLALTVVTVLAIVAYFRRPLRDILVELCGTGERATFWVAFSNITIVLVPLIFAMQYTPDRNLGTTSVLELAAQLKWALAGILSAVVILGWVLSRFIRRQTEAGTPQANHKAAR
jgi:hypothetical protein